MAFVGVGVFYVTLPDINEPAVRFADVQTASGERVGPSEVRFDVMGYLARGIRPVGVLIFVEAIAWFLLRQYRALIEDFKVFHRIHLRRVNYLAALKILSAKDPAPASFAFAAALLQEDLSGRLRKDETTETLEAAKLVDSNPVFQLFDSALKALRTGGGKDDK